MESDPHDSDRAYLKARLQGAAWMRRSDGGGALGLPGGLQHPGRPAAVPRPHRFPPGSSGGRRSRASTWRGKGRDRPMVTEVTSPATRSNDLVAKLGYYHRGWRAVVRDRRCDDRGGRRAADRADPLPSDGTELPALDAGRSRRARPAGAVGISRLGPDPRCRGRVHAARVLRSSDRRGARRLRRDRQGPRRGPGAIGGGGPAPAPGGPGPTRRGGPRARPEAKTDSPERPTLPKRNGERPTTPSPSRRPGDMIRRAPKPQLEQSQRRKP